MLKGSNNYAFGLSIISHSIANYHCTADKTLIVNYFQLKLENFIKCLIAKFYSPVDISDHFVLQHQSQNSMEELPCVPIFLAQPISRAAYQL